MKTFSQDFDAHQIERAIAAAETKTSGEIRVVVHRSASEDVVADAAREFASLGMHRTKQRNAVLIFLAPASHTFAIYGDRGIHEKCGQTFWNDVTSALRADFQRGAFTDGVIKAIERASDLLARHFPWHPGDTNELPDDFVDRGIVI